MWGLMDEVGGELMGVWVDVVGFYLVRGEWWEEEFEGWWLWVGFL